MKACKRCLLRESAEEDVYRDVRSRVDRLRPHERADDAVYERRLALCRTCEKLISGVCMKCGCYVEFRAALRTAKCPNASDRKW